MFCSKCGNKLPDSVKFCPSCGTAQAVPSANTAAGESQMKVGYSDRINDPAIRAAMKKNSKATVIFALIMVIVPIIGFVIYSQVTGNMELTRALMYGGIISAVFLLFAVISTIRSRTEKSYDATVISKNSRRKYLHNDSDGNDMYTEYIITVRTTDGRTRKIIENDRSLNQAYDYLQVGDRFRYHPGLNFRYELYDKSKAPFLPCVNCATKNPIGADKCSKCGLPLLK